MTFAPPYRISYRNVPPDQLALDAVPLARVSPAILATASQLGTVKDKVPSGTGRRWGRILSIAAPSPSLTLYNNRSRSAI
jgi:hypothetical protein